MFNPCVAFHIETNHCFAEENRWLVSIWNATLDWNGLISLIQTFRWGVEVAWSLKLAQAVLIVHLLFTLFDLLFSYPRSAMGYSGGDSLIHPMLITMFRHTFFEPQVSGNFEEIFSLYIDLILTNKPCSFQNFCVLKLVCHIFTEWL